MISLLKDIPKQKKQKILTHSFREQMGGYQRQGVG